MRKMAKWLLILAALVLVVSISALSVSAEGEACDGCEWGTSNGLPACVKGDHLHICAKNFPDAAFRAYLLQNTHSMYGNEFIQTVGMAYNILASDVEVSSMKGIELIGNLSYLSCGKGLTELDVSKSSKLQFLSVVNSGVKEIDVSNCPMLVTLLCDNDRELTILKLGEHPELTSISFQYTQVSEIDLSGCPVLQSLECSDSSVTELDLENNPRLDFLTASNTNLTKLDVSGKANLFYLSCSGQYVEEVDASNCTALNSLSVGGPNLKTLNMDGSTNIKRLYCGDTYLTELDLSMLPNLTELSCSNNQFETLDLSGCFKLETLRCNNNALQTLDLRDCHELKELMCGNNKLEELDLSGCPKLQRLLCEYNFLKGLDLSSCPGLMTVNCRGNKLTILDGSMLENLEGSSLGRQQPGQSFTAIYRDGYTYIDMAQFVGEENLGKLVRVYYYLKGRIEGEYDPETGIVKIEGDHIDNIEYHYDIGVDEQDPPNVTLWVIADNACVHEWQQKDCESSKICALCHSERWEAMEHKWIEATCTTAQVCEGCGKTVGGALGHDWHGGSCTEAKTCRRCGEIAEKPHGHKWKEATCKDPRTCLLCGQHDGEPGGHRWKDPTCKDPRTCTSCGATDGKPGDHKAGIWIVDEAPTMEHDGSRHRSCCWCDHEVEREELKKLDQGKVEDCTDAEINDYAGKLENTSEELTDKLLTEEEKQQVEQGELVSIALTVENIDTTISDEDQAAIAQKLGENTVGIYIDVSVYKQVGSQEPQKVTETKGAVTISFRMPEELRCDDTSRQRIYKIVRIHDGVTHILDAQYDPDTDMITFETDAFSVYSLVYSDKERDENGTTDGNDATDGNGTQDGNDAVQNDGDMMIWVWCAVVAVGVAAAVTGVIFMKKKK